MRDSLSYDDQKTALLYVVTKEGWIHAAWEMMNETILVFEYIPVNYPSLVTCFWSDKKDYLQSIKEVDWIVNGIDVEKNEELFYELLAIQVF